VVVKRITQENGRGGSGAAVSFLLSQYLGEQKNDGQPNRPSAPKSQSLFSVLSGLKMGTSSHFCFDAFNEAHANPAEFIGWPDRGGNFQRGLFYLGAAKMGSRVDAFDCARHFSCFHNLLSWLRR
jgi:hypothetical protein